MDLSAPLSILPDLNVEETINIMNHEGLNIFTLFISKLNTLILGYDQLPVIDATGKIEGVATLGSLKAKVLKGNVLRNDPVIKATYKTFKKVTLDTTLEKLNRILDKEHFALVVHNQRLCKFSSIIS